MMRDAISSQERLNNDLAHVRRVIKRDATLYGIFVGLIIVYIIFITSNLGA